MSASLQREVRSPSLLRVQSMFTQPGGASGGLAGAFIEKFRGHKIQHKTLHLHCTF